MAGNQPVKVGINGFGRIGAAGEGPMGDRLSSVSDCLRWLLQEGSLPDIFWLRFPN